MVTIYKTAAVGKTEAAPWAPCIFHCHAARGGVSGTVTRPIIVPRPPTFPPIVTR